MKKLIWITLCLTLAACEEKGVDDHSRHARRAHSARGHNEETHALAADPVKQKKVVAFEGFLKTGAIFEAKIENLHIVLRALLDGAFDPATELSPADIQRIGYANCTTDDLVGVRRFERTLVMAPYLFSMHDIRGLGIRDWLINLQRDDLLQAIR